MAFAIAMCPYDRRPSSPTHMAAECVSAAVRPSSCRGTEGTFKRCALATQNEHSPS